MWWPLSILIIIILWRHIYLDTYRQNHTRQLPKKRLTNLQNKLQSTSVPIYKKDYGEFSPLFKDIVRESSGKKVLTSIGHDQWCFVDFILEMRYSESNSRDPRPDHDRYYSAVTFDLGRELPNLIFDSKKSQGKQMKYTFDKGQKISLEGNFDTYFDTYHPAHYHVDLLSIITPEVMEKLIDAKEYDIEFYGNKIYIYHTIVSDDQAIDMIQKANAIFQLLASNVNVYTDTRNNDPRSPKAVHTYGKTAQRSFVFSSVITIIFGSIITLAFFAALSNPGEVDILTLIAFIIFGPGALWGGIVAYQDGIKERDQRRNANNQAVNMQKANENTIRTDDTHTAENEAIGSENSVN